MEAKAPTMYSPEECLPKLCGSGQNQFLSNSLTPPVIIKWGIGNGGLGSGLAWERLAALAWTSFLLLWSVSWLCFLLLLLLFCLFVCFFHPQWRTTKKSKQISIGNSWIKLALQIQTVKVCPGGLLGRGIGESRWRTQISGSKILHRAENSESTQDFTPKSLP